MTVKRFSMIVLIILLIVSVIMNLYLYTSRPSHDGAVEVNTGVMNNIKVSVSKISDIEDVVEFVVHVSGLTDKKYYTITLGSADSSSGVTLSEGNTLIRVGKIVNETQFIPYNTNLSFWTTHPDRILGENTTLHLRIMDDSEVEIFKMELI